MENMDHAAYRAPSADVDAPTSSSGQAVDCYLLVHNVSKKANIGTLARCATAFGK